MIAGRLNEVVKIFDAVETVNEYGERSIEYVERYTTRAKVEFNTGNRGRETEEIVFSYFKTFNLRSYVPISETSLIEWQGKRYRILTIEARREYNDLLINTELINE